MNWGFFEDHLVCKDGRWKKLYCFLMILGYSRMRYIKFVTDMSTNTLIRCHQNTFRYFGGYPEESLYDNIKQVIIKRLLKQEDSTLNRQFEDFAGGYGFKPILYRPYHGQTKGKVERTVQFVRDNFMVRIKYNNLADLNGQALAWCNKVNGKVHATTSEIPFERLKKEGLNPLPRVHHRQNQPQAGAKRLPHLLRRQSVLRTETSLRKANPDVWISHQGDSGRLRFLLPALHRQASDR